MWPWLASVGAWLVRLVGGWLPIGTKPLPEWLGKILWAVGIFAVCFFVTTRFSGCKKNVTPNAAQNQKAGGSITNYNYTVQPHFGCATLGGK